MTVQAPSKNAIREARLVETEALIDAHYRGRFCRELFRWGSLAVSGSQEPIRAAALVGKDLPIPGHLFNLNFDIRHDIYSKPSDVSTLDELITTHGMVCSREDGGLSELPGSIWNKIPTHHASMVIWDSTTKQSMVRFYQTAEHLVRGRTTLKRAGAYILGIAPDTPPEVLKNILANWDNSPLELHTTTDPDKIEEIYTHGPDSCMSSPAGHYQSSEHPTRVYGNSPDIGLAWIERGDRVTARALVRLDKTGYGVIYGDASRMRTALEYAGWSTVAGFRGCLIQHILCENSNIPILPYIDGAYGVEVVDIDGKKWFRIGGRDYDAAQTNGLAYDEDDMNYCDYHQEYTREDTREVYAGWTPATARRAGYANTEYWSEGAIADHATWSDFYDNYVADSADTLDTADGLIFMDDPSCEKYSVCEVTGAINRRTDMVPYNDPDDGKFVISSLGDNIGYAYCHKSDTIVDSQNLVLYQGEDVSKFWLASEGLDADQGELPLANDDDAEPMVQAA